MPRLYRQFRNNDVNRLRGYLEASGGAMNFDGRGHGIEATHKGQGADNFMSMSAAELQTDHRFRFVFLDGCRTASAALMNCFGIYPEELSTGVPLRDVVTSGGPRQISQYTGDKHPGAFLGYDRYVPFLIYENPSTHETVNGHVFHSYDALCNFHATLVATWSIDPAKKLREALVQAEAIFRVHPDGAPAPEASAKAAKSFDDQGREIDAVQFSPQDHMMVYGCTDITIR